MSRFLAYSGLFLAGLIVSVGTLWAFQRGANDFSVFHEAWKLILAGRSAEIYRVSPDRFLYAPGFAWLLAPLGALPRSLALAAWCFAKAAAIGLMIRALGSSLSRLEPHERIGVSAWAFILLARPFLIDFQYGQVNTFILGACLWPLLNHFRSDSSAWQDFLSWFLLAIAAITKLFPLPLLLVPFFVTQGFSAKKLRTEIAGLVAGLILVLGLPLLGGGVSAALDSYRGWADALIARGFPLESHNQSFGAFVHHVFSGAPIHVISWGPARALTIGPALLSEAALRSLSLGWTFIVSGILLGWIVSAPKRAPIVWISVLIGLLILPSHLVWKPYFLFGLPAAVLATARWRALWPACVALFAFVNLSGFDVIGTEWGARLEAFSVLLWCHLILLAIAARFRSGIET